MAVNSIHSSGYNFGSLASIKKQAQSVANRVEAESKARKAQQEATGLMKNAKGELVKISSIPEWEREVLEQRAIEEINSLIHAFFYCHTAWLDIVRKSVYNLFIWFGERKLTIWITFL